MRRRVTMIMMMEIYGNDNDNEKENDEKTIVKVTTTIVRWQ